MPEQDQQGYIWNERPDEDWGEIRTNWFNVNENRKKRCWIVDNFYEDPDAVRDFALKQKFFPGEGAVGSRTRKQFFFKGVLEAFEELMGKTIIKDKEVAHSWYHAGINGRFQWSPAGTERVYHCDEQQYAAMVYLTPDAPPETGTNFFRHKTTKIRHNSEIDWSTPIGHQVFPGDTFLDKTRYETVDSIGNVYNRLVIFDGGMIHSASEYFGSKIENSRLHHMFFFNCED